MALRGLSTHGDRGMCPPICIETNPIPYYLHRNRTIGTVECALQFALQLNQCHIICIEIAAFLIICIEMHWKNASMLAY